jgi:hypothetical protein
MVAQPDLNTADMRHVKTLDTVPQRGRQWHVEKHATGSACCHPRAESHHWTAQPHMLPHCCIPADTFSAYGQEMCWLRQLFNGNSQTYNLEPIPGPCPPEPKVVIEAPTVCEFASGDILRLILTMR